MSAQIPRPRHDAEEDWVITTTGFNANVVLPLLIDHAAV